MHVLARSKLRSFWETHPLAKEPLEAWLDEAEKVHWQSPVEIKQHYPRASILKDNRVVFNIHGNDFRLVVKIHYNTDMVYIRFIGTHAEYDRIDAETI